MLAPVHAGTCGLHDKTHWDQKYRFFSQPVVRSYYRTFAKARHDPFNKDPSWGRSIMQKLGDACRHMGCEPKDMFGRTSDGKLNRAELQNLIRGVLPSLSDMELTSIFNSLVEAKSGKVDADEFCAKLKKACAEPKVSDEISQRWKNPLYRIQRYAPCELELEGHLEEVARGTKSETKRANTVGARETRDKIPRPEPVETMSNDSTTYQNFNGGFDSGRFRRNEWVQARTTGFSASPRHRALKPKEDIPDPGGPDVRPGWHVYLAAGSMRGSKKPLSAP